MKILLTTTALALAVSVGSPASAQTYYGQNFQDQHQPGLSAFAQEDAPLTTRQRRNIARAMAQSGRRVHSINPAFDVYDQGRYISSDPDPFIRNELLRVQPDRDD